MKFSPIEELQEEVGLYVLHSVTSGQFIVAERMLFDDGYTFVCDEKEGLLRTMTHYCPLLFSENDDISKESFDKAVSEANVWKNKYNQLREETCLNELQRVLEQHNCTMASLPDGNYQVTFFGD